MTLSILSPLLICLLILAWTQAHPAGTPEDGEWIEMDDLGSKTLKIHNSCSKSDAKRIDTHFAQALDIASSAISTIDWALIEFASSTDKDEKRRISSPLKIMAGDDITRSIQLDAKRNKLRDLQNIFKRVKQKSKQPLIARCGADFLQEEDPEGNPNPYCEQEDKNIYWDSVGEKWISIDRPKCENTPVFIRPGNATFPDHLVFCPLGLELLKTKESTKDLKEKDEADIRGTFIDVLEVSPAAWIFHILLHTRQVGPYDNVDLGNGLRGYHWKGVRTLALKKPELWMENSGSISYIALAWYMNKSNWGPGQATDPSEKNPDILPTDHAEKAFGKGKGRLEEIDVADVRVLDPEDDPIFTE